MSKVINLTNHIIELYNYQDNNYIPIYPSDKNDYEIIISENRGEPSQILLVYSEELNNGDLFPVKFRPRIKSDIKIVSKHIISRFDTIIVPFDNDLEFVTNENKNVYTIDPSNTDRVYMHDYNTDSMIYRCRSLIQL